MFIERQLGKREWNEDTLNGWHAEECEALHGSKGLHEHPRQIGRFFRLWPNVISQLPESLGDRVVCIS